MLPLPARKSEFYRDVFQVIAEVGCTVVAPRVPGREVRPASVWRPSALADPVFEAWLCRPVAS